jgi:hypothetical protein
MIQFDMKEYTIAFTNADWCGARVMSMKFSRRGSFKHAGVYSFFTDTDDCVVLPSSRSSLDQAAAHSALSVSSEKALPDFASFALMRSR